MPPAPPAASTNSYHLTFAWDNVTNAQWYSVIVRTNGVEAFRRWSMTNSITVSNIGPDLDNYRFTCIATNSIGQSDESNAAALHWLYVVESDSLAGPWTLLKTNNFEPSSPSHFVNLTRWDAASVLQRD